MSSSKGSKITPAIGRLLSPETTIGTKEAFFLLETPLEILTKALREAGEAAAPSEAWGGREREGEALRSMALVVEAAIESRDREKQRGGGGGGDGAMENGGDEII